MAAGHKQWRGNQSYHHNHHPVKEKLGRCQFSTTVVLYGFLLSKQIHSNSTERLDYCRYVYMEVVLLARVAPRARVPPQTSDTHTKTLCLLSLGLSDSLTHTLF